MDMRRPQNVGNALGQAVEPDYGSTYEEVFNTRLSDWRSDKIVTKIVQQYRANYPASTVTDNELMETLQGKHCILDTEGKKLELATKGACPYLIKPNLKELEATLGIELRTMRTIRDAALLFVRLGVEHAVVSMGEMGAMYVSADKTLFSPALRVEIKSTVGAGDAMIGGMLLGYAKEKDMAKAFRYGIAAGAACVMTEGNQLLQKDDFDRLLDMVRVQEV
jgi:fructose-1-phosphate kinase PfkB-like protein